jgi:tetratricopeptide (TPR) repeat protein
MISRAIPVLLALALPVSGASAATKPAKAAAKTAAPAPEAPLTVDSLLAQAKEAATKGDTELAVRLAQAAIVQDPARTGSYVALGDVYASAGQPDYARSYYDAALDIDPADTAAQKALSDLNRDHPETTARNSK